MEGGGGYHFLAMWFMKSRFFFVAFVFLSEMMSEIGPLSPVYRRFIANFIVLYCSSTVGYHIYSKLYGKLLLLMKTIAKGNCFDLPTRQRDSLIFQ